MADFLTQTFAGAAGGMARAFKFSAMQDAEERRAERREESQIKLLMKQSELKEQQAARDREMTQLFQIGQAKEKRTHELTMQTEELKVKGDIATQALKGRQKVTELGITGRQKVAEIGVTGRKDVAELGARTDIEVANIKKEATQLAARIKKGKTPQDREDALDKTIAKLTISLETLKRTGGADAFTLALFADNPEALAALTSGDIEAATQELSNQIFRMQQEREGLLEVKQPGRSQAIEFLQRGKHPITEQNIIKALELAR